MPSLVTYEFKAMFCALNGATLNPLFFKSRQKAAAITLLPLSEDVPTNINALAISIGVSGFVIRVLGYFKSR
jgi:hypothetical protein